MSRIPAIDGLRAVAVAAVFAVHALPAVFPGGWVGVDLFFVISGFVITRSLLAEEHVSLGQFYLRRARRILPAALATVLICTAISWRIHPQTDWLSAAGASLSFMNWLRAFEVTDGGMLGHFWSLSIEEQFYLLWPACMLLVRRRPIPVLVGFVCVVFLWRWGLIVAGAHQDRIYNGLDTHSDGLALGCLLAFLGNRLPHSSLWLPLAGLALIMLVEPPYWIGYAAVSLLSFWIVSIASEERVGWLEGRAMQWTGSRSYSLYLWHFPILQLARDFTLPLPVYLGGALAATCLAAELSYRFVEQPFLKRRPLPARAEQPRY